METDKKHRKVLRTVFTKKADALNDLLSEPSDNQDWQQIMIEWEILQEKYLELVTVENKVYEGMLADATEEELTKEMDMFDKYRKRYLQLKQKCTDHETGRSVAESSSIRTNPGRRKFKLPTIELKKFAGDLKDWLPFWSQFKQLHEDPDIDLCDKIGYLTQATVPGSQARQIVESFPAISANYDKIIDCLQSRFGREDLQVEVYVRELLKLVLNRFSNKHCNVSLLYDNIESQLRSLETLGITSDRYAAILYPMIESCLPEDMIRLWHRSSEFLRPLAENLSEPLPESSLENRLSALMAFLQNEVQHEQKVNLATEGFGLSAVTSVSSIPDSRKGGKYQKNSASNFPIATAAGLVNCDVAKCIFCNGQHDNQSCFKTQKFTFDHKKKLLSEKKACFRCLKPGHAAKSNNEKTDQALANLTSTHIFLQTLRVHIVGSHTSKPIRALIDTGSQRSYILRDTVRKLGLTVKRREKIVHSLFGGKNTSEQLHECYDVTVTNGINSFTSEFLDQPLICGDISPIFHGPWLQELENLGVSLSDMDQMAPVEILLGADIIGKLYTGCKHQLRFGLTAIETSLGWTLMGKVPLDRPDFCTSMLVFSLYVNDCTIANLWELDIIGITDPTGKLTHHERESEIREFFNETIHINREGRYEVRLPWSEAHPLLPDNLEVARKRLHRTVAKLKTSNLFHSYDLIFKEWLEEGIIEKVQSSDRGVSVYYMPHRPVVKDTSQTTKIRPVFDASSHESGKPSLNQCLEVGPNMIELIPAMVLRFRQQEIGVVSDIRKTFLQVSVDPLDQDFLRFLWLDEDGNEIVYRHRRVVFGVSSSPFLLAATIEYHLKRIQTNDLTSGKYSEEIVSQLMHSFYVDNCVTSVSSREELEKFVIQSTTIMQEAKMDLRGWESSGSVDIDVPVLGLQWNTCSDTLTINGEALNTDIENEVITKRKMLSLTQRVFDPIGFTCPVCLVPKILLQGLWEKHVGWDIPIDEGTAKDFRRWLRELPQLSKIKIPRWVQAGPGEAQGWSLHTFSDSSNKAYAAAVFLRVEHTEGVSVYLITAKARVAPLKKISIPRLELLAATIAARLYNSVKMHFIQDIESHFWSDSTTVTSWIRRSEEWSVFVINRVKEIRRLTDPSQWHHVPGKQNPADLPSRGCFPQQLVEGEWWTGPDWLFDRENWPQETEDYNEEEINHEKKKSAITTLFNYTSDDWHFSYFSQYTKTLRMMAWIKRFSHNSKKLNEKRRGELTAEELDEAEIFVLRVIQGESLGEDCKRIKTLNTFVDELGLIRLKTRISERPDTMDFRLPIVLPGEHPVVRKLILNLHEKSCHIGTQGLLSLIREKYWTLGGRRVVRSVLKQCGVCKRHTGKHLTVQTPPLPIDRVRDASVFEVTGVDFAGPLYLRSGEKAWVCLFTCAVYRAVHIELVTSLSTNHFIQAFRRFVSRRGRPNIVYSDNGSNFVGFENCVKNLDWTVIAEFSSVQRIKWRFNPPTAAWWGGFWERLIGLLKGLLRRVLGRACLNYEDLLTLLCECENVVNSRPLTYLSDDPDDLVPLTPVMFLREQVEAGMPDCDLLEASSLHRKVRHRQQLRNQLRKRFRIEYLAQLKACKGSSQTSSIGVGDVVLLESDSKRIDWTLGKVLEVFPGKDSQVRVVRVKTAHGDFLRPLQRLYPLESAEAPSQDALLAKSPASNSTAAQTGEPDEACQLQPAESCVPEVCQESAGVIKSRVPIPNVKSSRSGRLVKIPYRYQN